MEERGVKRRKGHDFSSFSFTVFFPSSIFFFSMYFPFSNIRTESLEGFGIELPLGTKARVASEELHRIRNALTVTRTPD